MIEAKIEATWKLSQQTIHKITGTAQSPSYREKSDRCNRPGDKSRSSAANATENLPINKTEMGFAHVISTNHTDTICLHLSNETVIRYIFFFL